VLGHLCCDRPYYASSTFPATLWHSQAGSTIRRIEPCASSSSGSSRLMQGMEDPESSPIPPLLALEISPTQAEEDSDAPLRKVVEVAGITPISLHSLRRTYENPFCAKREWTTWYGTRWQVGDRKRPSESTQRSTQRNVGQPPRPSLPWSERHRRRDPRPHSALPK